MALGFLSSLHRVTSWVGVFDLGGREALAARFYGPAGAVWPVRSMRAGAPCSEFRWDLVREELTGAQTPHGRDSSTVSGVGCLTEAWAQRGSARARVGRLARVGEVGRPKIPAQFGLCFSFFLFILFYSISNSNSISNSC